MSIVQRKSRKSWFGAVNQPLKMKISLFLFLEQGLVPSVDFGNSTSLFFHLPLIEKKNPSWGGSASFRKWNIFDLFVEFWVLPLKRISLFLTKKKQKWHTLLIAIFQKRRKSCRKKRFYRFFSSHVSVFHVFEKKEEFLVSAGMRLLRNYEEKYWFMCLLPSIKYSCIKNIFFR